MVRSSVDGTAGSAGGTLEVIDLGAGLAYGRTLGWQRELNQAVIDEDAGPTVLLLEHSPVVTVTKRRGAADHLVASADRLAELGIAVETTDRGGDITYHGPGQLVAYPILPLNPLGLNLSRYMRLLESVVIATIGRFGVTGHTEPGATGVWVSRGSDDTQPAGSLRDPGRADSRESAKVCAMGVRIRRSTTLHGLALNVTTDLAHFETIVPCGLAGRPVTSLSKLLGEACPSMGEVKAELAEQLGAALGLSMVDGDWPTSRGEAEGVEGGSR